MKNIEKEFEKSLNEVKNLKKTPDDEELLILYGLYKQATEGNCNIEKPSFFNIKANRKYESWKEYEDVDEKKAMKYYVREVNNLIKKYGTN